MTRLLLALTSLAIACGPPDADGDGWPEGIDCDDTDPTLNPDTKWYVDGDEDGYGGDSSVVSCTDPSTPDTRYVRDGTDCDDNVSTTHPGAPEICVSGTGAEGIDNDCDGEIDDGCPTIVCGTVSSDTTWSGATYVSCDVHVEGSDAPRLTIADGSSVAFAEDTGLWVGWGDTGDLVVRGTNAGVTFTSGLGTAAPGDYHGLFIGEHSAASSLTGLDIAWAGGLETWPAALYVAQASVSIRQSTVQQSASSGIGVDAGGLTIRDTTLADNAGYGLYCATEPCLDRSVDSFHRNTVTGNGHALRLYGDDLISLSSTSTYVGNAEDDLYVGASTITQSLTIEDYGNDYAVEGDLFVQDATAAPILTVGDGVRMKFAAGSGLWVGWDEAGDLDVQGGATGVTMTSASASPAEGDWYGLFLGPSTTTSYLEGLTVEYGGGYAAPWYDADLNLQSASPTIVSSTFALSAGPGLNAYQSTPLVTDSTFDGNASVGVLLDPSSGFSGLFAGNTVTRNGGSAMDVPYTALGMLDASSRFTGNATDEIVAEASPDGIGTDTEWQDVGVPFRIAPGLTSSDNPTVVVAGAGAVLTIDAGVHTVWAPKTGLRVGELGSGNLTVNGTASDPVTFAAADAASGWKGLYFGSGTGKNTALAGFTVDGAGASTRDGAVHVLYTGNPTFADCTISNSLSDGLRVEYATLSLTNCTITGSAGDGIVAYSNVEWAAFTGNTITANTGSPILVAARDVNELESPNVYTGNTDNAIRIGDGVVRSSMTWAALDVPYRMATDLRVQDYSGPTLTLETGVTLEFESGTLLRVGSGSAGDIVADGVTFTSSQSTKAAGDWDGMFIGSYTSKTTSITNSTIEYGGNLSGSSCSAATTGNLHFYYGRGTFTGNTIAYSGSWGVSKTGSVSATISSNTYTSNYCGDVH